MASQPFHKTRYPGVYFRQSREGRAYYIDYRDDQDRRRRERVVGDLDDAKNALAAITSKRSTGDAIPGRIDITYGEYAEQVIDAKETSGNIRPQSATQYRSVNENHVVPIIGKKKLAKITKHDILAVVRSAEAKGLSGWTCNSTIKVMSVVFAEANWEFGIPNHVASLKAEHRPKKKAKRPMHVLEAAEIKLLLDEGRKRGTCCAALFALAVYSGLRQSELCGLWWEDLDLLADTPSVHVHAQLGRYGDRERLPYLKSKEEGESRTVEIPRWVAKQLAEWKLQSRTSTPTDFVFTVKDLGLPLSQETARKWYNAARDKAGIRADLDPDQRPTFHDMRDTFASVLIAGGANIVEVQHALGHDKASTTLDHYAHLWNAQERQGRLRDILEAASL